MANRAIGTQGWVQSKIKSGDISGGMAGAHSGTSIFDPVLCELAYRWFCPPGGQVLDPFAGGSVRGIVASALGRKYLGVDLRAEQIEANRDQAKRICPDTMPEWIEGDACELLDLKLGRSTVEKKLLGKVDFIFTCPPYFSLERYSDDERDLSTMGYGEFLSAYDDAITQAAPLLADDRFACFVVGEARESAGHRLMSLYAATVKFCEQQGLAFYNDAVLVTSAGSLPIRAGKQFENSRKLGHTHQFVLVFCKGDPVKAAKAIGKVEFALPEPEDQGAGESSPARLGGEI